MSGTWPTRPTTFALSLAMCTVKVRCSWLAHAVTSASARTSTAGAPWRDSSSATWCESRGGSHLERLDCRRGRGVVDACDDAISVAVTGVVCSITAGQSLRRRQGHGSCAQLTAQTNSGRVRPGKQLNDVRGHQGWHQIDHAVLIQPVHVQPELARHRRRLGRGRLGNFTVSCARS